MSIFNHFPNLDLTGDQKIALTGIQDFLNGEASVFILKGYAGSGKTTLLKGLVSYLNEIERSYQLMAPTGRAAKVINQKTGSLATTIHKGIYSFDDLKEIKSKKEDGTVGFQYNFEIRTNPEVYGSVLLVDEASMVSDVLSHGEFFRFGSGHLLRDLFTYSRITRSGSDTRIIFIGDPAQLPPIGMNSSPALDEKYLYENYNLVVDSVEMKEVKRHDAENGILRSASNIRKCLTSGYFNDFDLRENGKDIFNPDYDAFMETYKSVVGTKVIISYKNKTALHLNQTIRIDKFGADLSIQSGDIIIVGGNNYNIGIMNGEFGVVSNTNEHTESRIIRFFKKDGKSGSVKLTWRQVELLMPDENGQSKAVRGYMLENFLNGDNYLKPEEQQALYVDFKNRHPKLKPRTEEFKEAIRNDGFFNCILLKYGYAVTCHKAQGGEWDNAFVFWDKGANDRFDCFKAEQNQSGKTNPDFYRWAYTAVTRALNTLYCINPPRFNSYSEMSFIEVDVQNGFHQLTGQSITPFEIEFDSKSLDVLNYHNLNEAPLPIQDHLLKLDFLTNSHLIDIIKWERVEYEIRYYFKRENETAAIKFWVNGKNVFKDNYQKLAADTNSTILYSDIENQIKKISSMVVNRKIADAIFPKIEFEIEIEEQKPFLKSLHDSLGNEMRSEDIHIDSIDHHNYRERYVFSRGSEEAIVDFIYDGDGFFGRVLPIEKSCNSMELIRSIRQITNKLTLS